MESNRRHDQSLCVRRGKCIVALIFVAVIIVIIVLMATLLPKASKQTYNGYSFIRVYAESEEQRNFLTNFSNLNLKANFWGLPTVKELPAYIAIEPNGLSDVEDALQKNNITFQVMYRDLQKIIDDEEKAIAKRKSEYKSEKFDFENYHPYQEIVEWLQNTANTSALMEIHSIGETYEKRPIYMVHISSNRNASRPIIYINCGIHAREWISPAICLWMINQLIDEQSQDSQARELLKKYDWLIVPVSNPDGYVYTWTSDRMWRKNRRPISSSSCIGVDLNRNYEPGFDPSVNNSCSNSYGGPHPSSEKETQSFESSLLPYQSRLKAGLFLHSFSQLWLCPFGLNSSLPKEYPEMEKVMAKGVTAIRNTYGTEYNYGTVFNILYKATGTAIDYFYLKLGIVHSYLIELRDQGSYGFILPIDQILPTANETWNGIKAMAFAIS